MDKSSDKSSDAGEAKTITVLFVDDDASGINFRFAKQAIKTQIKEPSGGKIQVEFVRAMNAVEANKALEENPDIDFILCDYNMAKGVPDPEKYDGIAVVKKVAEEGLGIPIAVVSAEDNAANVKEYTGNPNIAFFGKKSYIKAVKAIVAGGELQHTRADDELQHTGAGAEEFYEKLGHISKSKSMAGKAVASVFSAFSRVLSGGGKSKSTTGGTADVPPPNDDDDIEMAVQATVAKMVTKVAEGHGRQKEGLSLSS